MILVTGATGFLGTHTIPKLAEESNETIRCFVRETSDIRYLKDYSNIELVYGSFDNIETFENALEGVDTLINIASLGFGHGPSIVQACVNKGVKRAIFISTTAMFTQLNASTKVIRQEAEKTIKESGINYTILRPTMIYGTEKDRNMSRLVKFLDRAPVFPVFGTGEYLQQPIHVEDLADAIVKAYKSNNTSYKAYNLSGKDELSYNEVINTISNLLNKKVKRIHLPVKPILIGLNGYEKVSKKPILKAEQVLRLNEHKNFKHLDAVIDFSFETRTFKKGIELEIESMKKKGII
ncbi:NAD(P)H-binding protein [Planococcus sp. MERTA32b]|nr:NAD(P)H-binding protein [Planococcus sp. MER TA 32b]